MDALAGAAVEVAGRLVREQQLRIRHERACQRGPLLLAAAELARAVVEPMRQADLVQPALRLLGGLALGLAGDERRHHHVLERRELGQQVVELEHEADGLVAKRRQGLRPHPADIVPREVDLAGRGGVERADEVQQRALPSARTPDDRHLLPCVHFEVDASQHVDLTSTVGERLVQPTNFQEG